MKNRLLPAIDVVLKPSLLLLSALTIISILSCLSIFVLPIPFFIKLIVIILIIFSTLYYILRDALLLLPCSWQRIEVSSVGQLRLTNKQGEQFMPDLNPTSFIHSWLVILNVKQPVLKQTLLAENLPAVVLFILSTCQQRRQLRVWLRWWKHGDAEEHQDNMA